MENLNIYLEGLFNADDTFDTSSRELMIPDELKELGLTFKEEIDGIYYCKVGPREYELNQSIIDNIPKEIGTLSIAGPEYCYVTGDLKNTKTTLCLPDQWVIFKNSKVTDTKFAGHFLDYNGPKERYLRLIFKKRTKQVSNCDFADAVCVMFHSNTKFTNCKFSTRPGSSMNFSILHPGDYMECLNWVADICGMPEITKPSKLGVEEKHIWDGKEVEMIDKLLKYFGIDNVDAAPWGIDMNIYNKSNVCFSIRNTFLSKGAGEDSNRYTLKKKRLFNL